MSAASERICPSCRGISPADAQFCRQCGVILPRTKGGTANGVPAGGAGRVGDHAARHPVLPQLAVLAVILLIGGMVYRHQRRSSLIPISGVPEVTASPASNGASNAAETASKPVAGRPAPGADSRPSSAARAEPNAVEPSDDRSRSEAERPSSYRGGWYRVRNRAPLYAAPDDSSAVITTLKPGIRVWVTRILPGFLAVQSVTGKAPGYVSEENVEEIRDSSG